MFLYTTVKRERHIGVSMGKRDKMFSLHKYKDIYIYIFFYIEKWDKDISLDKSKDRHIGFHYGKVDINMFPHTNVKRDICLSLGKQRGKLKRFGHCSLRSETFIWSTEADFLLFYLSSSYLYYFSVIDHPFNWIHVHTGQPRDWTQNHCDEPTQCLHELRWNNWEQ